MTGQTVGAGPTGPVAGQTDLHQVSAHRAVHALTPESAAPLRGLSNTAVAGAAIQSLPHVYLVGKHDIIRQGVQPDPRWLLASLSELTNFGGLGALADFGLVAPHADFYLGERGPCRLCNLDMTGLARQRCGMLDVRVLDGLNYFAYRSGSADGIPA